MKSKAVYIPHQNIIKVMILAGIPIYSEEDGQMGVVDYLYDYEFNLNNKLLYDNIRDGLMSQPSLNVMIKENYSAYKENYSKPLEDRVDIYAEASVLSKYIKYPALATELMRKYHGIPVSNPSKAFTTLLAIMNRRSVRQYIEVMLTMGSPFGHIASYINGSPRKIITLSGSDISAYSYFIWKWTPIEESLGHPLSSLINYVSANRSSNYYKVYRMMSDFDIEDLLSYMGNFGEEEMEYVNKKLFGMSSAAIMRKLKEGSRVDIGTVQICAAARAALDDNKKSMEMDEMRSKIDGVFQGIQKIAEKRKTMSEILEENESCDRDVDELSEVVAKKKSL